MEAIGVKFDIIASEVDESFDGVVAPGELVSGLACRKLEAVLPYAPDSVVISADTIVWCGGEVFGKPRDLFDAHRMLRAMSGGSHEVYTGIAVGDSSRLTVEYECTKVYFRSLADSEIDAYLSSCSVLDKAGAYGIQERAALFVERVEGDYYNIVGLPLCRLGVILRRDFSIEI